MNIYERIQAQLSLFVNDLVTLGEAVARAMSATGEQDVRKTWILFGDPTASLK